MGFSSGLYPGRLCRSGWFIETAHKENRTPLPPVVACARANGPVLLDNVPPGISVGDGDQLERAFPG